MAIASVRVMQRGATLMMYAEQPYYATQPDLPVIERPVRALLERPWRSFLKAISWRAAGSIATTAIAYVVTGSITVAIVIGLLEIATKTILYYLHERIWSRVYLGLEVNG